MKFDGDPPREGVPCLVRDRIKGRGDLARGPTQVVPTRHAEFSQESRRHVIAVALELDPQRFGRYDRFHVCPAGDADQLPDPALLSNLHVIQIAILALLQIELAESQADLVSGRVLQEPDALRVQGITVRVVRRRDRSLIRGVISAACCVRK